MNLIDGVDGLAAGVGLFAVITVLVAALLHGNSGLAFATVPLAGALLGFLRYNFSPASIFLGDCGSLTLGFLLGCYGIVWTEKSTTILSMIAPLMTLFVPLLDVGLTIVRRLITGRPIFVADRRHIHHRLLSRGLPPTHVVFILYGFCALASIAGLLLTVPYVQYRGLVVLVVFVAAWLGIRELGYMEFGILGKSVLGGQYQRWFLAQVDVVEFEKKVMASRSLDETWELLCSESPAFGFSGIEMRVDGETWQKRTASCCHLRIDFPGRGYIGFTRDKRADGNMSTSMLFVECVERALLKQLEELEPQRSDLPVYAEARLNAFRF
jgi:UDP-GlcNAc:undecaprenyl-phosphate/decaprenyl-phosphate GlcNAc-1-phosphate transferase